LIIFVYSLLFPSLIEPSSLVDRGPVTRGYSTYDKFLSFEWMAKLENSGRNPSTMGFYAEQIIISSLAVRGCTFDGAGVFANKKSTRGKPAVTSIPTIQFLKDSPTIRLSAGRTLYVPQTYNYGAVDAILIHLDDKATGNNAKKAVIMGIQITISTRHSDSELNFFAHWKQWTRQLDSYDVKAKFLWIWETPPGGGRHTEDKKASTVRWANKRIKLPDREVIHVSVADVDNEIGRRLAKARAVASKPGGTVDNWELFAKLEDDSDDEDEDDSDDEDEDDSDDEDEDEEGDEDEDEDGEDEQED
jgi:hypothetical protein